MITIALIKIHRRKKKDFITKEEFLLTRFILDSLEVESDDFSLVFNYSQLYCGDRLLYYPEHYSDINIELPKNVVIFRPLINERHSNILIEMFEELDIIESDSLNIEEFENESGKTKYKGYFMNRQYIVEESVVKSSPSIPILKTSIVIKTLLDERDFNTYKNYLKDYLYGQEVF